MMLTVAETDDILRRAIDLDAQGGRPDGAIPGAVYLGKDRIAVRHEIWLALRAMILGKNSASARAR